MLSPYTGSGVFQRQVYRRLATLGFRLEVPVHSQNPEIRIVQALTELVGTTYGAALVCSTPAPLVLRAPTVACVFDLRWRRTRGAGPHLYHHLNLRRLVGRADQVFVTSVRTQAEMLAVFPHAVDKCSVVHLGPGIVHASDFSEGEPGSVLLLGSARYKRNEVIAEALVRSRPDWAQRFLCVGVNDSVFATLASVFGPASCERFENVDDDGMRTIFRRAHVYISASLEEGFGLPMVEALTAGCQVVAIRQTLTSEIMGDGAVLIEDGDEDHIALQLQSLQWPKRELRLARAAMYSWDRTANVLATALRGAAR